MKNEKDCKFSSQTFGLHTDGSFDIALVNNFWSSGFPTIANEELCKTVWEYR